MAPATTSVALVTTSFLLLLVSKSGSYQNKGLSSYRSVEFCCWSFGTLEGQRALKKRSRVVRSCNQEGSNKASLSPFFKSKTAFESIVETIASRLEDITSRLEAIALRLEAIAARLEAIAARLDGLRLEAIAARLGAIASRCFCNRVFVFMFVLFSHSPLRRKPVRGSLRLSRRQGDRSRAIRVQQEPLKFYEEAQDERPLTDFCRFVVVVIKVDQQVLKFLRAESLAFLLVFLTEPVLGWTI